MGDGGIALGAIFAKIQPKSFRLKNIFWGPKYSNEQIKDVLKAQRVNFEFIDEIEKKIARLLSNGEIVARFHGAMEYGPRALGNRSILAPATNSNIMEILNEKLQRNEFMPFAPALHQGHIQSAPHAH